jgi:voltage-gated potassium channel
MRFLANETIAGRYVSILDRFVKPLIWYSVVMTVVETAPELGLGAENSVKVEGLRWFLWSERLVTLLFSLEFIFRCIKSSSQKYIYLKKGLPIVYPTWAFPFIRTSFRISPFAVIDLIAIVPFWVGFFLPVALLNYVRFFRVFRLLKFYRYSRSLQLNALAFFRSYNQLKGLAFQIFITSLVFTMFVYEAEHKLQPDAFGNLSKSSWFTVVTSTTVGYGDRHPTSLIGMIVVGISLPLIIAQVMGAIGIINTAFNQVMEEERNPDKDPIKLFAEEWEEQHRIKQLDQAYKMEE